VSVILEHSEVQVYIDELPNGRREISLKPFNDFTFIPIQHYQTSYPIDLIQLILTIKGPYLCDEIRRDNDPSYVQKSLEEAIFLYLKATDFENKRILDFGCGSGASTVILAKMFPTIQLVGVDFIAESLSIAKARAKYYGFDTIKFLLSPSNEELPENMRQFDYVMLSAVYEHLLPNERIPLLSQIYKTLKPGGILFINQTPNRFFPIERHTTGIPLLNYMPDRVALAVAHRLSKRVSADEPWETLLRKGIRGATEQEIRGILHDNCGDGFTSLRPRASHLHDSIDIWYERTSNKHKVLKRLMKAIFKGLYFASGIAVVPDHLTLAIRKDK